jgi:hypothetical protein
MIMNKIYRKELTDFTTNTLLRMKYSILKKAEEEKLLSKNYSHMLVDVLSELDSRRLSSRRLNN